MWENWGGVREGTPGPGLGAAYREWGREGKAELTWVCSFHLYLWGLSVWEAGLSGDSLPLPPKRSPRADAALGPGGVK